MTEQSKLLQRTEIHGVQFRNRLLRSSVGGRTCNYDGTVTDVWKNFEKRFADGGVGGIISTTFHVNADRLSPPQYPSIASKRHQQFLKKYLPQIQENGCKYIVQIGDPGYVTYSSLFPDAADALSSSGGFDAAFGYPNTRREMSRGDVQTSIQEHAAAAARAQEAGADGVEITASKGYLIHQFLNPGINRRTDEWGGSEEKRLRFLEEVLQAVRDKVGPAYLVGVRLSACDFNARPALLALGRWPSPFVHGGNDDAQMIRYAKQLAGVDYLHVVAGYGFPNPRDVPGAFPFEEVRMFFDSVRHLSTKAAVRAAGAHLLPRKVGHWLFNLGWSRSHSSLEFAANIKRARPDVTVITNGGYLDRASINAALERCDMVSMARALIATPDLVHGYFEQDRDVPAAEQCTQCNRCVGRTTTSPLGCYELKRFGGSYEAMFAQILEWNRPDP
jgi:2,4-dienoyl-CoA reductase (NADPH2)